ncbi:Sensors of blue-light using FAD [Salegentibacter salinarum]|nr:Sensors of blue-light using FAD [Salegentibacter salinarum]
MFKYLAYVSRQSHLITDNNLKELLSKSQSRNSEIGVTGM